MSAVQTSIASGETRRRLLDDLRRSEVDVDAARARVEVRAGARRRRRVAAGTTAAAALLLIGAAAAFTLGGTDPDDVVADRDDRSTSTVERDSTTTTTVAQQLEAPPPVETTSAPSTVAPTTTAVFTTPAPAPVPSAPASRAAAPSTSPRPVNAPMTARMTVATPRVPAGSTTAVDITWSDADHSGTAPTYLVDWGDPAVSAAAPAAPVGVCDRPGRPAGATDRLEFRHATPGRHRIRVELRTCASGEFAERLVLEGTVEVTDPELDGAPAVAVVLHREDTATPALLLPALDSANASLGARQLPARVPALAQRVGRGAATVVLVPSDANDEVALEWPSTLCRAAARVDLAALELRPAPRVLLSSSC